jgi:hypothetical protein
MLKTLITLGALVRLSAPSLAAAQEPPPSEPPPLEPPPPAPPLASPAAARPAPPPTTDLEEPRAGSRPAAGGPPVQNPGAPPQYIRPAPVVPERSGATFEMSLGLGNTRVSVNGGGSELFTGISGLNLGVGGWLSPRAALTLRVAGTSFVEQIEGIDVRFIAGWIGMSLQHMAADQAWLGGGIGLGVLTTDQDNTDSETGLGLDLRAGVNLYQSRQNAIHLAVEVTPGFYRSADMATFFVDRQAGDLRLSPSSPARGFGEPGLIAADLDGNARPMPSGSLPDVGAYEAP